MSEQPLPERVDPLRLAHKRGLLEGALGLESLPRLQAAVRGMNGPARVWMRFDRDSGRTRIEGGISAGVALTCQRCLEPVVCPVEARFQVEPVTDVASACALDPAVEPVLMEDGLLPIHALVEEEILLALPPVALHEDQACPVQSRREFTPEEVEAARRSEHNPFAVLGSLKGEDPGDGE
ncbi:MAG: YceD family protein [Ectothiorhodospira sp.]